MTEFFDTGRLRDEPAHWDELAERIAAHAARGSRERGLDWCARSRTGWIAVSLLLALTLGFMVLPGADGSAVGFSAAWERAVAPSDDVGRALAERDSPPALGALLLVGRGGGVR